MVNKPPSSHHFLTHWMYSFLIFYTLYSLEINAKNGYAIDNNKDMMRKS